MKRLGYLWLLVFLSGFSSASFAELTCSRDVPVVQSRVEGLQDWIWLPSQESRTSGDFVRVPCKLLQDLEAYIPAAILADERVAIQAALIWERGYASRLRKNAFHADPKLCMWGEEALKQMTTEQYESLYQSCMQDQRDQFQRAQTGDFNRDAETLVKLFELVEKDLASSPWPLPQENEAILDFEGDMAWAPIYTRSLAQFFGGPDCTTGKGAEFQFIEMNGEDKVIIENRWSHGGQTGCYSGNHYEISLKQFMFMKKMTSISQIYYRGRAAAREQLMSVKSIFRSIKDPKSVE